MATISSRIPGGEGGAGIDWFQCFELATLLFVSRTGKNGKEAGNNEILGGCKVGTIPKTLNPKP